MTHSDIIRLSKLQNDLFPDYDFLKRCLDAQQEAVRTKSKPPPIRDMIRHDEDAEQVYADNELIPLSYSGIADP